MPRIKPTLKPVSYSERRTFKKVSWASEDKLTAVKIFRMNDEPTAKGMTKEDIERYFKEAEQQGLRAPLQFQETRLKHAKMEKAAIDIIREKDTHTKQLLLSMHPDIDWLEPHRILVSSQIVLDPGPEYHVPDASSSEECERQKQRESRVFVAYYAKV